MTRRTATIVGGLAALALIAAAVVAGVLHHTAALARLRIPSLSPERISAARNLVWKLGEDGIPPGKEGAPSTTRKSSWGFNYWRERLMKSHGDRAYGIEASALEYENEGAAEEALEKQRMSLQGKGVERPSGIPGACCVAMEVPPKDPAHARQVDVVLDLVAERCVFRIARSFAGALAPTKLEDAPLPSEETVRALVETIVPGGGGTRPLKTAR